MSIITDPAHTALSRLREEAGWEKRQLARTLREEMAEVKRRHREERRAMLQRHREWLRLRRAELDRQAAAAAEKRQAAAKRDAALQALEQARAAAEALGLRITVTVEKPAPAAAAAAGGGAAGAYKRPLTYWQTHMKRVGTLLAANGVSLGGREDVRALASFCSTLSYGARAGKSWEECWRTPGRQEAAIPDAVILELARRWIPGEGYTASVARASAEIARAAAGGV